MNEHTIFTNDTCFTFTGLAFRKGSIPDEYYSHNEHIMVTLPDASKAETFKHGMIEMSKGDGLYDYGEMWKLHKTLE